MLTKLGKTLFIVFGSFVLVVFVAMSIANSPIYAWRLLRYFASDTQDYKIFPERVIENDTRVSFIPRGDQGTPYEVEYLYNGKLRTEVLEDLLKRTGTRAFLIIKDEQLICETYLESSRQEINTSFSVAKSFDSTMIGAAIQDGYIDSVNDLVIKYVPEIAGRGLDTLTIRNLLRMDTGIRYIGDDEHPFYMVPFGDDAFTYYSPDMRRIAMSVEKGTTPIGAAFHYNNYHPLLEGLIIERATGMHVAEYLQERIWKPMGAEFPASWSLDSEASGFEKMESGINARAIDFARFGLIFLHDGFWNGVQILPEAWVHEATAPDPSDSRPFEVSQDWQERGGYYGYHWWGMNNADGTYDYTARGHLGQSIYVAPRKNMVIVRFGSEADSNVIWPIVIKALVDKMP